MIDFVTWLSLLCKVTKWTKPIIATCENMLYTRGHQLTKMGVAIWMSKSLYFSMTSLISKDFPDFMEFHQQNSLVTAFSSRRETCKNAYISYANAGSISQLKIS